MSIRSITFRSTSSSDARRETCSAIPLRSASVPVGRRTLPRTLGLEPDLTVSAPDDVREREADRVARHILSSQAPVPARPAAIPPQVQRKCTACRRDEDTDRIQRKALPGAFTTAVWPLTAGLGQGEPLPAQERTFFEERFGEPLNDVRLHEGVHARRSALSVDARAYTVGRDIVFAEPPTRALLAHELAHVLQQRRERVPVVGRIRYGSGTPTAFSNSSPVVVPAGERPRVNEAIHLVDDIVDHPDRYPECHNHYAERCPGGGPATLASVWRRAVLWRVTDLTARAVGVVGGSDIAYTQEGYDEGARGLAQSLMHEAGHNCGIPGGSRHWHAGQIATYCMGAGRTEVGAAAGGYLGTDQGFLMLTYRRFLGDWADGRVRATLGADVNIVGSALEARDPRRPVGEFASAMAGVQGRVEGERRPSGGWGGPRFGGLTLRVETGFGAGRFSLRPGPSATEPGTTVAPSWVLQVGPRAEFLIPDPWAEGLVIPFSIGLAYRLAVPLNPEAEHLHALLGTLEFRL